MADADPATKIEAAPPPARPAAQPAAPARAPLPDAGIELDEQPKRSKWRLPLMMIVPLIVLIGGALWWFSGGDTVSTDNAYVKQDIVSVAGEVSGRIVEVNVRENQIVKKGDILFTIDDSPYRVAVEQANAQIAGAQANVTALSANVGATAADIAGARDDLALAQANYSREKALMDRGFNTRARMDAAQHEVASARDKIASIQADVARAQAQLATGSQVPGVNPAIAAGQAMRDKAQLELARTVVRAPADGRISQATRLQVGQMVAPGVPMLSIVREDGTRVDANFKETDLGRIRPGQPAVITVDAFPGVKFQGKVESIGAGTGSEFSVLPAQNATGNWVKVIQRVPVRIAIKPQADHPLVAGLSAVARIDVSSVK
ncbi:HlyD family secretion protein [Novosphingobium tardum]|uniref:HlyD family secretion protein n=1 Tax=Novosphingobium tardum TaxID=1538021 RepID=A0ABV8RPJ4_9SPHN